MENQLKTHFLNGASVATLPWSTAGGASYAQSYTTQGSKSVAANLSFEYSISATFGPPGDSVSVSAGLTASFTFNYTWTTSEMDQIQTTDTLAPLNSPPPAGAYSSYTYDVLLLAHDASYTSDLIALLQSYPTTNNNTALAQIAPNSAPWKIVHVLRSYELAGPGPYATRGK